MRSRLILIDAEVWPGGGPSLRELRCTFEEKPIFVKGEGARERENGYDCPGNEKEYESERNAKAGNAKEREWRDGKDTELRREKEKGNDGVKEKGASPVRRNKEEEWGAKPGEKETGKIELGGKEAKEDWRGRPYRDGKWRWAPIRDEDWGSGKGT